MKKSYDQRKAKRTEKKLETYKMKILNFMIGSTLAQFDPFMSKFNVDFVVNSEPAKL